MKRCKECGAYNKDERNRCVDCGTPLGKPLSAEEEQAATQVIRSATERLYNGEDPLHISLFDKIIGSASAVGLVVALVILIFGLYQASSPKYLWFAVLAFAVAAVECFVPRLMWELEQLRLSLFTDGAEPGGMYGIIRRTTSGLLFAIALSALLVSWFNW